MNWILGKWKMLSKVQRVVLVLSVAILAGLIFVWKVIPDDEEIVDVDLPLERPECPYDTTEFALSGPITGIPEFHDCQRFIVKKGFIIKQETYGALYAVWVRYKLDSAVYPIVLPTLPPDSSKSRDSVKGGSGIDSGVLDKPWATSKTAVPVALIYSFGGRYHPLGIEPAFNCLYLYHPGSDANAWAAIMVSVDQDQKKCFENVNPDTMSGTLLTARPAPQSTEYAPEDVPAVGRWDRDPQNGRYYVGLRCGGQWCEIGPEGFKSSEGYESQVASLAADSRRVYGIKGWYDEQRLALASENALIPGSVVGIAFPAPALHTLQLTDFEATTWITAAYTVLLGTSPEYKAKLNFDPGSVPGVMNTIALCHGAEERCIPESEQGKVSCPTDSDWWAMIVSGALKDTTYRCVAYRPHPEIEMPGTVRWRWLANDETTWVRCPGGCCQVT